MAPIIKDSFLDLERHRQLLEENIEKLRKSLRHWQLWEAEYEGLKEEILAAGTDLKHKQLASLCRQYEGDLVTGKEIEDILGGKTVRTAAQVVNLLERRVDYVGQNVKTVEKQVEVAENKLAAATVVSTPDVRNEEGLPMADIVEELDDDGNIISSRVNTPGSTKPQLLEVLEKAGVKDIPSGAIEPDSHNPHKSTVNALPESAEVPPIPKPTPKGSRGKPLPQAARKGVKFAEDTKPGPEVKPSQTAKRLEQIMDLAKRSAAPASEPPTIPTNEEPEDAALRREMLQYGMSEVGAVVAELTIEEGSDWSEGDYEDDDSSSTDDEEDKYGRSTRKVVDDELRKQMLELEKRLGVRMMENVGKKEKDYDVVDEGIGRIKINGKDETPTAGVAAEKAEDSELDTAKSPTTKKSVRFSESLDISPDPIPSEPLPQAPRQATIPPVSDIVERTPSKTPPPAKPHKKVSRFKAVRQTIETPPHDLVSPATNIPFSPTEDATRPIPTGPEGKIIAPTIIERAIPPDTSVPEPDELDPHLVHQEVAMEYHRMRNRMIQRQGGFVEEEESEIVPFTEEEGGPRRVSRFKAARLAGVGM